MKDFSLKVWAKNVGVHYTWQNEVYTSTVQCISIIYKCICIYI